VSNEYQYLAAYVTLISQYAEIDTTIEALVVSKLKVTEALTVVRSKYESKFGKDIRMLLDA